MTLNCGALPDSLFESELFGYEKGAFTGAMATKIGRFELADGGTLLLDEVGELSLKSQVDFLRVLETKEFRHLGGTKLLKVDTRSSPPPIGTWKKRSSRATFGKTSTTGSMSCPFASRPSVIGGTTSYSWPNAFSVSSRLNTVANRKTSPAKRCGGFDSTPGPAIFANCGI